MRNIEGNQFSYQEFSSNFENSPKIEQSNEQHAITPETLLADNHSENAEEKRAVWNEARLTGNLTAVFGCGDARLLIPDHTTVNLRSIATAGNYEPYARLFNSKGVRDIVVMAHHDGETVTPGEVPTGCGGLHARAQVSEAKQQGQLPEPGVLNFVDKHVHHPDVIRQAYQSAFKISALTEKPVLAVTQDHIDGTVYPVAAFWDGGRKAATAFPLQYMSEEYYNSSKMYADGIPVLDEDAIPDNFAEFLDESKRQAVKLHEKYRGYMKSQKVQNPQVVALNAGIRPYGVTQPDTLRDPNIVFQLSVARDARSIDNPTAPIHDEVLESTFDQAEYPLTQSVANVNNSELPFAKVDTVLIETRNIDQSERIARKLHERPWMKEWSGLPNKQVIISQKQAGLASQIEVFEN